MLGLLLAGRFPFLQEVVVFLVVGCSVLGLLVGLRVLLGRCRVDCYPIVLCVWVRGL